MRIIASTEFTSNGWLRYIDIGQLPSGLFEMQYYTEKEGTNTPSMVGRVRAYTLMELIPLYAREIGAGLQKLRDVVYEAYDLEYNRLNGVGECTQ